MTQWLRRKAPLPERRGGVVAGQRGDMDRWAAFAGAAVVASTILGMSDAG